MAVQFHRMLHVLQFRHPKKIVPLCLLYSLQFHCFWSLLLEILVVFSLFLVFRQLNNIHIRLQKIHRHSKIIVKCIHVACSFLQVKCFLLFLNLPNFFNRTAIDCLRSLSFSLVSCADSYSGA